MTDRPATDQETAAAPDRPVADRRAVLRSGGGLALSAGALLALTGCETIDDMFGGSPPPPPSPAARAPAEQTEQADARLLNQALAIEHEAVNAYQIALDNRAVQRQMAPVLQLFQSHHREHRDALTAAIRRMGGNPAAERPREEYAEALQMRNLRAQNDVLRAVWRVERNAVTAYLNMVPSLTDRTLAQAAARIAADDTMHWTALAGLLRENLPAGALTFGG